jgi:hypothetical protein
VRRPFPPSTRTVPTHSSAIALSTRSMSYENERWWDEVRYYVDDPWFVQVVGTA